MTDSQKFSKSITLKPQTSAPVAPENGEMYYDSTTDKFNFYQDGAWVEISSSAGGASDGAGGLDAATDILDYQIFDSLSDLSTFTTTGTTALQTVNPIDGTKSVSIPTSSSLKKVISVPAKYRGKKMTLRTILRSTATYGSVTVQFYDETNATNIGSAQTLPTGSVSFLANTTTSSNQLSSVSGLTPRIGMQVTGSGIPANTLITALSPLTLSQAATATASSVTLRASDIAAPQVLQVDIPDSCASFSYTISVGAETGVETVVDDLMVTYVPQIQQTLVQEPDSYFRITGFTATLASTATRIISLTSGSIQQNQGDAIQYLDDSVNGARFTARKEGLYTFSFSSDLGSSATAVGFSLNSTNLTTPWYALPLSEKLIGSYDSGSVSVPNMSTSAYLRVGDIVRLHTIAGISADAQYSTFTASYQGKLKQVNVASDQKLDLPVSRLRMEGSTGRGSTDTATVLFSAITKLVSDGMTVTNSAANGTIITIQKDGYLCASSTITKPSSGGGTVALSLNQSVNTALPTSTEILAATGEGTVNVLALGVSWQGQVKRGDVIRVSTSFAPLTSSTNIFDFSLIETKVQVSVSNTLPQWSENDSESRVQQGNGFGSTHTQVRRFANIQQNYGAAITYADSATFGSTWTINEDDQYDISFIDRAANTTAFDMSINLNSTTVTSASILAGSVLSGVQSNISCSWSGKLSKGDVIRAMSTSPGAINPTALEAKFTICKKGKPNVTGIDVTPFVNIKTNETENIVVTMASLGPGLNITGSPFSNTNRGILTYNSTTGVYTVNKKSNVSISAYGSAMTSGAATRFSITVNSTVVAAQVPLNVTGSGLNVAWSGVLQPNDTFFVTNVTGGATVNTIMSTVMAVAESDTIVTPVTSFSTDSTPLVFKSTAIIESDPIGTFNTYKKNANTFASNVLCTTAPTQLTSSMNANGIQLFTAAYNAASSDALPSAVEIYIGKGMKGSSVNGYSALAKAGVLYLDRSNNTSTVEFGADYVYNESTGILRIDAGTSTVTTNATKSLLRASDYSAFSSGYFVVNASKSPSVVAIGLNVAIAASYYCTVNKACSSTQPIDFDGREFDTHNAVTIGGSWRFTAPAPGLYQILGACFSPTGAQARVYKGGTHYKMIGAVAQTNNAVGTMASTIRLNKDEYIDIRPDSAITVTGGALNGNLVGNISIVRISL